MTRVVVVGTCGNNVPIHFLVWKVFPYLFALPTVHEDVRSKRLHQNMVRYHRCVSDMQIYTASEKSTVKQVDPVKRLLQANAHFIYTIWCGLPVYLVWERRSYTPFFSTTHFAHDHFNQLCSNEGKIVPAQVLPHEAAQTLPECIVPLLALSCL